MSIVKINSTVSMIAITDEGGELDVSDGKLTVQARGSEVHINVSKEDANITAYIATEDELDDVLAVLVLAKQKYHKYD